MSHFIIASILMANYLDTDLGKFMQYLKQWAHYVSILMEII
jgi:hypothetical protein